MLGAVSLIVALILSIFTILAYFFGIRKGQRRLVEVGQNGAFLICGLVTIASLWLFYLLFTRDFQNAYVYGYSSRSLPPIYTLSAFWAGQEGSLLFWTWINSIFIVIVAKKSKVDKFTSYAAPILVSLNLAFILLLTFISNPFERLAITPSDGFGLNPVLQDPGMVIHPPILFLGYAGFMIPFAFAMAGLITEDGGWIKRSRLWTIFSWINLGVGIVLGGWWAYHVLGWGGYWAWDPVENASFLPWLTSTALLHSAMIQEKKKGMRAWNVLLAISTFVLIIFGTFLTRSGVMSSVHAYAESESAMFYMVFIMVLLMFSLGLLIVKLETLETKNIFESLFSKETSFLIAVLIFVVLTLVILLGTSFPLISEAIRGHQVNVGQEYYNRLTVPIGGVLILLIGICPLLAWKKTPRDRLISSYMYPTVISIVASIIGFAIGLRHFYAVCTVFISFFVFSTHIPEFLKLVRSKDIFESIVKNHRRYGAYIVHISIVMIAIGIIGSSVYDIEETFILESDGSKSIDDFDLIFKGTTIVSNDPSKESLVAIVDAYRGDEFIVRATPMIDYYAKLDEVMKKVYIHSTALKDLYIIFDGYEGGIATFTVRVVPMINLIWIGTVIMLLGAIVAILPEDKPEKTVSDKKPRKDMDKRFEEEYNKFKKGGK